jgi:SAM-dependent methyltransferase
MPEAAKAERGYCCVNCMAVLSNNGPGELDCHSCARAFPVIDGIPVLTSRPHEMLMVHLQEFRQAQEALEKKRAALHRSKPALPGTEERARRMLQGLAHNLNLIETVMKPIEEHLSGKENQLSTLIDWALAQNVGSAPQTMLPFFYQDWARTGDFANAESLITSCLLEHRPDEEAVAILGAGACGIVHATAKHFRLSYGVDLSLPTLLLAREILSGHPIEVCIPTAGWRCARLTPPLPHENEIRLICADVGSLPFAEGSLSAVVTQYLMDITGDPLGVAAEIQRVLKPGGIWVNFSNPFRIPGEPSEMGPPEPADLPELFRPFGLDIIKVQRTRFTLQNLEQIYAGGHRNAQEVHFFIGRKTACPQEIVARNQHRIWDPGSNDSWWRLVPRIIPGRDIQIIRKRVCGPEGIHDRTEIGLNAVSFGVSEEHTAFVEALFSRINGKHTLHEILHALLEQGISMSGAQFRELIHSLLNQYCVITLDH